jgi:hypothetical protein
VLLLTVSVTIKQLQPMLPLQQQLLLLLSNSIALLTVSKQLQLLLLQQLLLLLAKPVGFSDWCQINPRSNVFDVSDYSTLNSISVTSYNLKYSAHHFCVTHDVNVITAFAPTS